MHCSPPGNVFTSFLFLSFPFLFLSFLFVFLFLSFPLAAEQPLKVVLLCKISILWSPPKNQHSISRFLSLQSSFQQNFHCIVFQKLSNNQNIFLSSLPVSHTLFFCSC